MKSDVFNPSGCIDGVSRTLAELITPLVERQGITPTALGGVTLLSLDHHRARTPLLYQPSLIIIAQGRKIGYLGDREIHYDPGHYLVQTLPLPFECEPNPAQSRVLQLRVKPERPGKASAAA